jgi:Carboxypeptidase regulatory-like domain
VSNSAVRNRLAIAMVLAATGAVAARQVSRPEPQATGTGAITGRVVEAGTGTPVANARLWLHQAGGEIPTGVYPRSEELTSDSAGAFAFRNLPTGQFSIQATADGYQPGAVGKRRPQAEEAWITLESGQAFSNATVELFRGGTISGVVTNDRAEPMKEVHVETWLRDSNGMLSHRHGAITDAAGAYRITAVPAGDHFVVARVWHDTMRQGSPTAEPSPCSVLPPPPPPGAPSRPAVVEKPKHAEGEWFTSLPRWIPAPGPDDRGQPRTIPTTIYPGVSELSQASAVSILGGDDRTGIDLQLRPTATTTIQGQVVPLPGKKIGKGSEVRLRLPGAPSDLPEHRTWVQPDNTFRFLGVAAGSYVLEVQLQEVSSCDVTLHNSEDVLTQVPLDVPAAGLDDVVVPISSGLTMHGRIRFVGKTPRPELMDILLTPTFAGEAKAGEWDDDVRIMVGGLIPGRYALEVSQNGRPRWFVRSMTLGRLDLATHPVAIDRDGVSGVEVMMTDRPSPLDGRIVDATGTVVRDATVVVFPVDRASWSSAHDGLAGFARTRSLDGTYRFGHLVPGDYFIAAVDERRMHDWPRPGFLEAIARQASPVRIVPGEPRTLKLTLQAR